LITSVWSPAARVSIETNGKLEFSRAPLTYLVELVVTG
jgi:hypothetical protein